MTNLLQNLQNKPESAKKMIMWTGIGFIMLAVFSFWLFTFSSQISQQAQENKAATDIEKQLPGVWQTFKDQFNNLQKLWAK